MPTGVANACVEVAEEIEAELGLETEPAALEGWLQEREQRLLQASRHALDEPALAGLETAIERDLAPYRERMPASVVQQVRKEALARGLLARFGLPRLSLFHT